MGRKGSRWRHRLSLTDRIERLCEPEPMSGCWLWVGHRSRDGYGQIGIWDSVRQERGDEPAHRVAYRAFVGPIPDGLCVCHRCDNPPCVNPVHLFLGTHQDNLADCRRKGRRVTCPGERHGMAKLTRDQVREIERLAHGGTPQHRIAALFGIRQTQVSRIARHETWRWLWREGKSTATEMAHGI